jgi:membrane protein DedA with SNARE-associated domain
VTGFLDPLLNAPQWAVLLVVGLVVFAEDAFFVGFVVPGETAAILGGVAASRSHVSLTAVLVVVIAAAIVGDTVGYEIGRHVGPRILALPIMERRRRRLDAAQAYLARRGGMAVLLGRWTAFFRAVMPALAGSARMPYSRFITYNATGGIAWGLAVVLAGYFAGESFNRVESVMGTVAAVVLAVLVLAGLAVWLVSRRRREAAEDRSTDLAADDTDAPDPSR